MATHDVDSAAVLTHQDMCRLFDLDDDDLPTSNGYMIDIWNSSCTVADSTTFQHKSIKRLESDWQNEITQPVQPHTHVSFKDRTSSDIDNYAMTLLETAALAQDKMEFQALVKVIPWSTFTPSDLVKAIRMALALEAPLIARKLAEQGQKYFPTHSEINKIARILAAPTAKSVRPTTRLDVKANKLWITTNREAYKGKWVALHDGKLIISSQTFSGIAAKVGDIKGKGILVTQVT